MSCAVKRVLALRVVQVIVKNFECGLPPPTADGLAGRLEVPRRLLQGLLDDLVACGMLACTKDSDGGAVFYRPAKSTADLTLAAVTEAFDGHGVFHLFIWLKARSLMICNGVSTLLKAWLRGRRTMRA